ncbi:hypothetical protein H072_1263 [Dactylellina haptotyla CBS 200.50]|uniref:tRNA pseudouridine(55) synthase n=1 Tax=Dactylellina haptotyla (strain CBS 200.50) TaxID=1284197 RepID=S8AUU7_DACHA|nr:hypothetical protein H072_1263 [Dactylellina haptotyla CBS 200.50]
MVTNGIIAVNKPGGRTSAQLLRELQSVFNKSDFFADHLEAQKQHNDFKDKQQSFTRKNRRNRGKAENVKLGHGGTLDPMATGVMIVGVGTGTKRLNTFLDCTKEYEAVAIFGASTDTYDREGKITARKPYGHITREAVEGVLDKFRGDIFQRPPIFSALNLNGKRLYEYAREGLPLPVEIKKRPCNISSLEIIDFEEGSSGHKWSYPTEEATEIEKAASEAYQNMGMEGKEGEDIKGGLELSSMSKEDLEAGIAAGEKRKAEEIERKETKRKRYYDRKAAAKAAVVEAAIAEAEGKLASGEVSKGETEEGEKEAEEAVEGEGEGEGEKEPTPPPPMPVYHEDGKPPVVHLRMTVSRGTYVRSIVHDIGHALGSAATLVALTRSRQGDYALGQNVIDWADFTEGDAWVEKVRKELESQEF